jgi:NAD(P)-dependent dehydrogenase (short-subunit alcohol dehydrogenase family)
MSVCLLSRGPLLFSEARIAPVGDPRDIPGEWDQGNPGRILIAFSTNHLGHFQLVTRLWPVLRQAGGARVISVSSWAHRFSPVVFDDFRFERRDYDRWLAYGQSKTANILFALALDERGKAKGASWSARPSSPPIRSVGLRERWPRRRPSWMPERPTSH